jgi:hypothetical protein
VLDNQSSYNWAALSKCFRDGIDSVQNDDKYAGKGHEDMSRVDKQTGKDAEIEMLKVEMEKLQLQLQQAKLMEPNTMLKTQQATSRPTPVLSIFATIILRSHLYNAFRTVQALSKRVERGLRAHRTAWAHL